MIRLNKSLELPRIIPRRFLFSEVDVEMQILSALSRLCPDLSLLTLQHVEGHQDTKYPTCPLPWNATLNQRCDQLASLALDDAVDPIPLVTFLPASQISLVVGSTTITHHLPTQIRTLAGLPALRTSLCTCHSFDEAAFNLINWELFHSCTLSVSFSQRIFLLKWLHNLLPFQSQQLKFGFSPSSACPSNCGHSTEDRTHFLCCSHPDRLSMWEALYSSLLPLFSSWHLDPSLQCIFLYILAPLCNADPIPLDNLTDEYTMLLETQLALGADSILYSLLSTDWVPLQQRYLVACNLPHTKNEASRALKRITTDLMLHCHSVWLLRNQHLHASNPNLATSYKKLHLLAQIKELYDSAPQMLEADKDMFATDYDVRSTFKTAVLQRWYRWAKPLVAQSIKDATEMGKKFRRINDYFRPEIPPELVDAILGRPSAPT